MLPSSRAQAKAEASHRYFTGIACKHGHVAERWTRTGICTACSQAHGQKRLQDPEEQENARVRARAWASKNMQRVVTRVAKSRAEKPDQRRAWDARYRANNRDQHQLANQLWRESNPGYFQEHHSRHRERYRAHARNTKARRKAAPGQHTAADVEAIFKMQRGRCAHCRVSLADGYHVDHIMPIARGGSNERRNLQLLCEPCNLRKGAKDPLDFAREHGRLL